MRSAGGRLCDGGIPEVVVDGETGYLVPVDQLHDGTGTPTNPDKFVHDMADAINRIMADPEKAKRRGQAGYERARDHFSWESHRRQDRQSLRGRACRTEVEPNLSDRG